MKELDRGAEVGNEVNKDEFEFCLIVGLLDGFEKDGLLTTDEYIKAIKETKNMYKDSVWIYKY